MKMTSDSSKPRNVRATFGINSSSLEAPMNPDKPNSVCKWCNKTDSGGFHLRVGEKPVRSRNGFHKFEPVAEPAEPSASQPSSFPGMEIKATVALDSGDGGTRRACNNENCSKDYLHEGPCSAPQPVADDSYGQISRDWTPCPICESEYDGTFCHACRNQVAGEGPRQCISELVDLRCERDYHEKGNHYAYENGKLIQWVQYPARARAPEGTPKLEEIARKIANSVIGPLLHAANGGKKISLDFLNEVAIETEAILRPFITPACSPHGKMEVSTEEYGNLLAIWQTAVMLFSGPPNELPDVEAMRRRMHELATPASTGELKEKNDN